MEEFDCTESPKSPKTPKLSEEVSEMTLKSPLNDSDQQKEEAEANEITESVEDEASEIVEQVGEEDLENNPELDNLKELLKQIIESAPAGQVEKVSNICKELFGGLPKFIEKESKNKMIKDGFIFENRLIIGDNEQELNLEKEEAIEESEDEFKKELKGKLEKYVKELYPETGNFLIHKSSEKEWKIHILAQRIKPKAFWSGYWRSTWTIEFKNEQEMCFSVNGNVELIVHYHEEGTVQLSTKKEIPSRVDMKAESLTQAADKIYWKIKDSEDAIQLALNEAYQQLSENIFKKLRRQLPVTRTKMDWSKFANYNLSNELKK